MCIVIRLFLLLAAPIMADAAPPDSTRYQLPTTEVTATRTRRASFDLPLATAVVTDVLRARPGLSLDESLRPVPGLFVSNRHNLSQGDRLSLRGLGARAAFGVRGLMVLLDGIPLTMPDGQSQLNNLDLGATGRVEVLRGPSSALYGNAGGGVIAAHTSAPADAAWRVEPRVVSGSHGLLRLQTRLSGQTADTRYFASVYDLRSEGYRDHADARARGLNARATHRLDDRLEVTLLMHLYDAPYLFNPSSLDKVAASDTPHSARGFVVGQGASKKVRQSQAGLRLNYRWAPGLKSALIAYGVERALVNPIPGRIVGLDRTAFGLRSEHEFAWEGMRINTGFDLDAQSDERREFANDGLPDGTAPSDERIFELVQYGAQQQDQGETVRSFGPFASLEKDLTPALSLTLAGRYDHYRFAVDDRLGAGPGARAMSQFSPMAGLVFTPAPLTRLYAHAATAFQTPTTSELGNRPEGAGGFNPELEPERILGVEVGLRHRLPSYNLGIDLVLFQLQVRDALIPFQVEDPQSEEIYFRNAGRTRNRGIELALDCTPRRDLRAALTYAFGDYVFEDYRIAGVVLGGNEVPGVPRHRVFASLGYRHAGGLFADFELERVGSYWANDFNGPAPGGDGAGGDFRNDAHTRADMRLGLDWRNVTAFLVIENLLAARYNGSVVPNAFGARFFEPAPGRTLRLGLGARLGD